MYGIETHDDYPKEKALDCTKEKQNKKYIKCRLVMIIKKEKEKRKHLGRTEGLMK